MKQMAFWLSSVGSDAMKLSAIRVDSSIVSGESLSSKLNRFTIRLWLLY